MQPETALIFWWLNIITKKRYDQLLEQCGSLDQALLQLSPALFKKIGVRDDTIQKTFARIEEFDAVAALARLKTIRIRVC
jgi:hypothetical protein